MGVLAHWLSFCESDVRRDTVKSIFGKRRFTPSLAGVGDRRRPREGPGRCLYRGLQSF